MKFSRTMTLNILFLLVCAAIIVFLVRAPEETTPPLPHDSEHNRFFAIESKKEAEKFCLECHDQTALAPLPENHPPKYRCLFCHKRK